MDQARTSLGAIEHPIHALIRNASLQWDQLVSRQSKTLEDAVKQYRLRYGKHPPKGFDRWWVITRPLRVTRDRSDVTA